MKIVLVHGIFNDGNVFKWLAKDLRAVGHECFTPSLTPANAKHGVRDLAHKLQAYILQTIGPDEPLILVGFSMGCMISRYYLQLLQGYQRTTHFFAISGPHQGTLSAYAYWGKGAHDLRPESAFVQELQATDTCLKTLKIYSYWTPYDLLITPASSSEWHLAENQKVSVLWHAWMPYSRQVRQKIVAEITQSV